GDKDWRIAFNESRQPHTSGAHVPDLKEPVLAERLLNVQIPILRVGQVQVAGDYEQRHRLGEGLTERIRSIERIRERVDGETDLLRLEVRRRADGILQRPAFAGIERLVENSVGR